MQSLANRSRGVGEELFLDAFSSTLNGAAHLVELAYLAIAEQRTGSMCL